jgi:spermidine synthase
MTCPAPAFLEKDFLLACRAALREGGMFVVNVVSRAEAPYAAACAMLKEVSFPKPVNPFERFPWCLQTSGELGFEAFLS